MKTARKAGLSVKLGSKDKDKEGGNQKQHRRNQYLSLSPNVGSQGQRWSKIY
jgi:hypothetical protein